MRIPFASLAAMNASDLVMFALGLALIVGGRVAPGWNRPPRHSIHARRARVSELPDNVTPCVGGDP